MDQIREGREKDIDLKQTIFIEMSGFPKKTKAPEVAFSA
jgi:hypothetical protein